MVTAHDVALYLRSLVNYEEGDLISQLKLYKLVYYAQAWSLVFLKEPLFRDEIQAWKHGPVPVTLRANYGTYGRSAIPEPAEDVNELAQLFTNKQLKVLDLVWEKYGEFNATKLYKLCHIEAPWVEARGGLPLDADSRVLMPQSRMRQYYAQYGYVFNGEFVIENEVLRVNKKQDLVGHAELKNGDRVRIKLSDVEAFLEENRGKLKKKSFA